MTTIIYKNGILASDTRSSFNTQAATDGASCRTCGSKHDAVKDDSQKIRLGFTGQLWKGEKIIAVSGCGNATEMDKVIECLRKSEDIITMMRGAQQFATNQKFGYELIIVTEKNIHVVDPWAKEIKQDVYGFDSVLAWGSGAAAARFVEKAFNATAIQAINAAIFHDKGSGGSIQAFDVRPGKSKDMVTYESDHFRGFREMMHATNPFKNMVMRKAKKPGDKEPPAPPKKKIEEKNVVPEKETPTVPKPPRTRKIAPK